MFVLFDVPRPLPEAKRTEYRVPDHSIRTPSGLCVFDEDAVLGEVESPVALAEMSATQDKKCAE